MEHISNRADRVIDVWAQITTPRMAEQEWMASLLRWTRRAGKLVTPTVADTVLAMDRAKVTTALLSAWYGPTGSLISNDEVAAQIDAQPDRFRGLASADIRRPAEAARQIRDWLRDDRFVGVRVVPWLWELPPTDRRFYPIFVECVEAGVPLCTQIGHTGPLKPSEPNRLIPHLERVMLDFPELVVVGGHLGFPWFDEVISMTVKFENFHIDTSAYAVHRLPAQAVDYIAGLGTNRTMFGTNWPMLSPDRCLGGLDDLGLDAATVAAFLHENAERVFGLTGSGDCTTWGRPSRSTPISP